MSSPGVLSFLSARDEEPEVVESPYGYIPTTWICVLFIALFGISTFIHFIQALMYRAWFIFPTAILCGLVECLGWAGRYWASRNVMNNNAFMIQITATILAPTPFLAAVFILFGRLTRILGTSYGILKPRLYTTIFLGCDIIALAIQGGGGGIASGDNISQSQQDLGSNLMLAGIIFQLVAIVVFMVLAFDYLRRYRNERPVKRAPDATSTPRGELNSRLSFMIFTLALITVLLIIRAVYRTIELADGWDGEVMGTQWLFNVFDATMVVLAMYALNVGHPGVFLRPSQPKIITPGSDSAIQLMQYGANV